MEYNMTTFLQWKSFGMPFPTIHPQINQWFKVFYATRLCLFATDKNDIWPFAVVSNSKEMEVSWSKPFCAHCHETYVNRFKFHQLMLYKCPFNMFSFGVVRVDFTWPLQWKMKFLTYSIFSGVNLYFIVWVWGILKGKEVDWIKITNFHKRPLVRAIGIVYLLF